MLVTRETDYAVRTVLYLAKESDLIESATEIAHATHILRSFLVKILQRLVRSRILMSTLGSSGGFRLAKKPTEISLFAIMEAIQGLASINICAVDKKQCRLSGHCTVHPNWFDIRKEVEHRPKMQTIAGLL